MTVGTPQENPGREQTDAELVGRMNEGDAAAFEILYLRYRDWAARLAQRFTGNHADSLDVMQGAFEYFLKKFPGFKLTASMTTFLYPVVKHLAIAAKRARERNAPGEEALDGAPARGHAAAARGELEAAVGALEEGMRETLVMRYVDDMTMEEIAAALKIPVGTVKSRLHRAIAILREDPRARSYFLK